MLALKILRNRNTTLKTPSWKPPIHLGTMINWDTAKPSRAQHKLHPPTQEPLPAGRRCTAGRCSPGRSPVRWIICSVSVESGRKFRATVSFFKGTPF